MKLFFINLIDWLLVGYRPDSELRELNRLLVKAGRRSAYDLKHAANDLHVMSNLLKQYGYENERRLEEHNFYLDRACMWLAIFSPADDGKSYRDRLHQRIYDLEMLIEKYQKLLNELGIEDPIRADEIPF